MGWTAPRTWVVGEVISKSIMDLHIKDNLIYLKERLDYLFGRVEVAPTELTISSGVITVSQGFHTVDTESDAASDDLATINGGVTGMTIILRAEDDTRTVVVKHNTGNIWLVGKADISLDDIRDSIRLIWDGTKWCNSY
ncbi:hypothetical protein M0R72_11500 [Candidatus Pacearchaeota archaeon]|jgi:hypothetical protein|nr:hypothetical protein [Candidatus Pacearchaeota archaeon]